MPQDIENLNVGVNQPYLNQSISRAIGSKRYSIHADVKFSGQALGRIKGELGEFEKSLAASNARVLAFGASAGAIFAVSAALKGAIKAGIEVQQMLADINVILGQSSKGLETFSSNLFDIASKTGQSFAVAAKAAQELSRQGLGVEQTLKRTSDALILARISGLSVEASVSSITATLNSFNNVALDSNKIVNQLAAVDAKYAVSSGDLAEALKRVGSTANDAGVSFEELIALVTAAQQTTSRGGAVIGNAFKSIFTRIQRPKVLEELDGLGVQVKDAAGNVKPIVGILGDLAGRFDTLSAAQRSYVSELVGGIYQINILKATLGDLSKGYSIYAGALNEASSASDEANRRNEELNKTLSSKLNKTLNDLTGLGAKIGGLSFEPAIRKILSTLSTVTDGDDAEKGGLKYGEAFFAGMSKVLSGPGLAFGTLVASKLALNLGKFLKDAAKDVSGYSDAEKNRLGIAAKFNNYIEERISLAQKEGRKIESNTELERGFLKYITDGNLALEARQKLTSDAARSISLLGYKVNGKDANIINSPKVKAAGHIPTMLENLGALAGGYAPGDVKSINLGGKQAYYNTAERVIPVGNSAFIVPPAGSKARNDYDKKLQKAGYDPRDFRGNGFVPNLAGVNKNSSYKEFLEALAAGGAPQGYDTALRGAFKTNRFSDSEKAAITQRLAEVRLKPDGSKATPPSQREMMAKRLAKTQGAASILGGKAAATYLSAQSGFHEDINYKGKEFASIHGLKPEHAAKFSQIVSEGLSGIISKAVSQVFGANPEGIRGFDAAGYGQVKGRIFETVVNGVLGIPGAGVASKDLMKSRVPKDRLQGLSQFFEKSPDLSEGADLKSSIIEAKRSFRKGQHKKGNVQDEIYRLFGTRADKFSNSRWASIHENFDTESLKKITSKNQFEQELKRVRGKTFGFGGHIPNLALGRLDFRTIKSREFEGLKTIRGRLNGAHVGDLEYEQGEGGAHEIGMFEINKEHRGKGYAEQFYKQMYKEANGFPITGQLLPQTDKALEKLKNGQVPSVSTLFPQIRRAQDAKTSSIEGHYGLDSVRKLSSEQFSEEVQAAIDEYKNKPTALKAWLNKNSFHLTTEHSGGHIPNLATDLSVWKNLIKTIRANKIDIDKKSIIASYQEYGPNLSDKRGKIRIPNKRERKQVLTGPVNQSPLFLLAHEAGHGLGSTDDKRNMQIFNGGDVMSSERGANTFARNFLKDNGASSDLLFKHGYWSKQQIATYGGQEPFLSSGHIPNLSPAYLSRASTPEDGGMSRISNANTRGMAIRAISGLNGIGDEHLGKNTSELVKHLYKTNPELFRQLVKSGAIKYGHADGLIPALSDAVKREKNAGYTPQIGFDNRIGPMVYGKEQGSAQNAIRQHRAMGQSISDIKKAGKSGGFIPNLAVDEGAGLDIGSGFGMLAAQMAFSRNGNKKLQRINDALEAQAEIVEKENDIGPKTVEEQKKIADAHKEIAVLSAKKKDEVAKSVKNEARQNTAFKFAIGAPFVGGALGSLAKQGGLDKTGKGIEAIGDAVGSAANAIYAIPGPAGLITGALVFGATAISKFYKIFNNASPDIEKKIEEQSAYLQKVADSTGNFAQIFDKLSTAYDNPSTTAETIVKLQEQYMNALSEIPEDYRGLAASAVDATDAQRSITKALDGKARELKALRTADSLASRLDDASGAIYDGRIFSKGDKGEREIKNEAGSFISSALKPSEFTNRAASANLGTPDGLIALAQAAKAAGELSADAAEQLQRLGEEAKGLQGAFDHSAEEAGKFTEALQKQAQQLANIREKEKVLKPVRDEENRYLAVLQAQSKSTAASIEALNDALSNLGTKAQSYLSARDDLRSSGKSNLASSQTSLIENLMSKFGDSMSGEIKTSLDNALGLFKVQNKGGEDFRNLDNSTRDKLFGSVFEALDKARKATGEKEVKNPINDQKITDARLELEKIRATSNNPEDAASAISKFIDKNKDILGEETLKIINANESIRNELIASRAKLDQDFKESIRNQLINNDLARSALRVSQNTKVFGGAKGTLDTSSFKESLLSIVKGSNQLQSNNPLFKAKGSLDLITGFKDLFGGDIKGPGAKGLRDLFIKGRAEEIRSQANNVADSLQVKGAQATDPRARAGLFAASASAREFAGPRSVETATDQYNSLGASNDIPENIQKQVDWLEKIYNLLGEDIKNGIAKGGSATDEINNFTPESLRGQAADITSLKTTYEKAGKSIEEKIQSVKEAYEKLNQKLLDGTTTSANALTELLGISNGGNSHSHSVHDHRLVDLVKTLPQDIAQNLKSIDNTNSITASSPANVTPQSQTKDYSGFKNGGAASSVAHIATVVGASAGAGYLAYKGLPIPQDIAQNLKSIDNTNSITASSPANVTPQSQTKDYSGFKNGGAASSVAHIATVVGASAGAGYLAYKGLPIVGAAKEKISQRLKVGADSVKENRFLKTTYKNTKDFFSFKGGSKSNAPTFDENVSQSAHEKFLADNGYSSEYRSQISEYGRPRSRTSKFLQGLSSIDQQTDVSIYGDRVKNFGKNLRDTANYVKPTASTPKTEYIKYTSQAETPIVAKGQSENLSVGAARKALIRSGYDIPVRNIKTPETESLLRDLEEEKIPKTVNRTALVDSGFGARTKGHGYTEAMQKAADKANFKKAAQNNPEFAKIVDDVSSGKLKLSTRQLGEVLSGKMPTNSLSESLAGKVKRVSGGVIEKTGNFISNNPGKLTVARNLGAGFAGGYVTSKGLDYSVENLSNNSSVGNSAKAAGLGTASIGAGSAAVGLGGYLLGGGAAAARAGASSFASPGNAGSLLAAYHAVESIRATVAEQDALSGGIRADVGSKGHSKGAVEAFNKLIKGKTPEEQNKLTKSFNAQEAVRALGRYKASKEDYEKDAQYQSEVSLGGSLTGGALGGNSILEFSGDALTGIDRTKQRKETANAAREELNSAAKYSGLDEKSISEGLRRGNLQKTLLGIAAPYRDEQKKLFNGKNAGLIYGPPAPRKGVDIALQPTDKLDLKNNSNLPFYGPPAPKGDIPSDATDLFSMNYRANKMRSEGKSYFGFGKGDSTEDKMKKFNQFRKDNPTLKSGEKGKNYAEPGSDVFNRRVEYNKQVDTFKKSQIPGSDEYYAKNQALFKESQRTIGYGRNGQAVYARQDLGLIRSKSGIEKDAFLGEGQFAKGYGRQMVLNTMPDEQRIRAQYNEGGQGVQGQVKNPESQPKDVEEKFKTQLVEAVKTGVTDGMSQGSGKVEITWPTLNVTISGTVSGEGGLDEARVMTLIKEGIANALGAPIPVKASAAK